MKTLGTTVLHYVDRTSFALENGRHGRGDQWEEATPGLVVRVKTLLTTDEDETYIVLTEPHLHWKNGRHGRVEQWS